uniref:ChbG/HpnK family deacetylase n=1 Tax=Desulfatirhabdium butyrativorans TaxID=340467 RepID=A0A7C4RTN1_9BACT
MPPPNRPPVRLIVNADDLGISEPINDGIFLAHRLGLVTSASIMPVGKAFDHALERLADVPHLDIGIHLTLVAEEPLIRGNTTLVNGGNRFPKDIGAFLMAYLTGGIRLRDIHREWTAQIEKALDRGIAVTHMDSHQHVHVLPGIADITRELADRYGIPFVRMPSEPFKGYMLQDLHSIRRLVGEMVLKTFCLMIPRNGTLQRRGCMPRFLGFFFGGRLDSEGLKRILASTVPGETYELMCHPGFSPKEPEYRQWNYRHEGELMTLASPRLRCELEANGIHLCRFWDLITDVQRIPHATT